MERKPRTKAFRKQALPKAGENWERRLSMAIAPPLRLRTIYYGSFAPLRHHDLL